MESWILSRKIWFRSKIFLERRDDQNHMPNALLKTSAVRVYVIGSIVKSVSSTNKISFLNARMFLNPRLQQFDVVPSLSRMISGKLVWFEAKKVLLQILS